MQKVAFEEKFGKRKKFFCLIEILLFLTGSLGFDKWKKGIQGKLQA